MKSRPLPTRNFQALVLCVGLCLLFAQPSRGGEQDDPERDAPPPPSPKPLQAHDDVLFSDTFSGPRLKGWKADRDGVWSVQGGVLKADLPDSRQEHSFLYTGSSEWTDYAVDLDVCAMRGADKGVAVRVVEGSSGIGVDLRGPGYQDVILNRREWPMGKARAINGNTIWQHLRVEARGHRYRVFVNGNLAIDKIDSKRSREKGGIALAAYTGGVGECTVYYDNVLVTSLGEDKAAKADESPK
jgi:3-keto-disaccharide hydrolase